MRNFRLSQPHSAVRRLNHCGDSIQKTGSWPLVPAKDAAGSDQNGVRINSKKAMALMPRPVLDESRIHPAIRSLVADHHSAIVQTVQEALKNHAVVVVGMAQNPVVKAVRKDLTAAGVAYFYLEFGSYFSQWRQRTALKMWTGWPTFPMVFADGVLLGGAQDVKALIASGELGKRA